MDDKEINQAVASQIADMASAGKPVPVDPDDAEMMGAFVETALDADDALESRFDDVAEGGEE
ncbi:putative Protein traD [Magnetospirillum gryphiswaldense MSR-1 v2]|jgi:hypothetical protein|uniref:Uncharacterized protein n=1 Tax=Magnetospirillum gryphiswaldense (strain DSM 6361 / JCM 21280 / NBRC 15271 / MSR-1) TaxID=431944 RepID=V6F4C4_MAGGM|nr:hypothetical protein [Magnetospirillum gryphiswaldense]CDK99156.1 putative Protein traD [Magnetospirillum gryphiswaldense MSR-1 v2]